MIEGADNSDGIQKMRQARERPAVQKLELAKVRSANSGCAIFIVEGDDDRLVYSQWVRRCSRDLSYVFFVARGKTKLLSLRVLMESDHTGLMNGVGFFVDRDFDDLRGQMHSADTLMTCRYSVENYLVDPQVVRETIENEFHCYNEMEIRTRVMNAYYAAYQNFLQVTRVVNFRVFLSQKARIPTERPPKRLGAIASVSLSECHPVAQQACELEDPQFNAEREEFSSLDPHTRFRGKFALLFLMRWFDLLADEWANRGENCLFNGHEGTSTPRRGELSSIGMYASRSPLPSGMCDFVSRVADGLVRAA